MSHDRRARVTPGSGAATPTRGRGGRRRRGDAARRASRASGDHSSASSSSRRSRSCTSSCRSWPASRTPGAASRRATRAGWRPRSASSCSPSAATSRSSAPSSCRGESRGSTGARATRSRWPAWRRRACSRPPARAAWRSPRGRCGARGWPGASSRAGWSPSWSCSTASTWLALHRSAGSGCASGVLNGDGAVRAHRRAGDLRRRRDRRSSLAISLMPADFERRLERWAAAARGASRAGSRAAGHGAGLAGDRRPDGARPRARTATPACSARSRWWALRHRDAVGVLPRLRRRRRRSRSS